MAGGGLSNGGWAEELKSDTETIAKALQSPQLGKLELRFLQSARNVKGDVLRNSPGLTAWGDDLDTPLCWEIKNSPLPLHSDMRVLFIESCVFAMVMLPGMGACLH